MNRARLLEAIRINLDNNGEVERRLERVEELLQQVLERQNRILKNQALFKATMMGFPQELPPA
jgi:hypothetical protein